MKEISFSWISLKTIIFCLQYSIIYLWYSLILFEIAQNIFSLNEGLYLKFVYFYIMFEIYGKIFILHKRKFLFNYLNLYKYFLLKLQVMVSELSMRFLTDPSEVNKHLNRATYVTCNFSQSSTSKVTGHVNKCLPAIFAT